MAALVMGLYPPEWGRTLASLYDELTGAVPGMESNEAMQWGTDTEPEARARLNADMQLVGEDAFVPMCAVHPEYAELRASLDGISPPRDEVAEFKCPTSLGLLRKVQAGHMPAYYYAQVQHILMVTGVKLVRFRVHYKTRARGNVTTASLEIPPRPDFIKLMQRRELDFYEDVVYRRRPTN